MVSLLPLQGQFRLILLRALFTGKETELRAKKGPEPGQGHPAGVEKCWLDLGRRCDLCGVSLGDCWQLTASPSPGTALPERRCQGQSSWDQIQISCIAMKMRSRGAKPQLLPPCRLTPILLWNREWICCYCWLCLFLFVCFFIQSDTVTRLGSIHISPPASACIGLPRNRVELPHC